MSWFNKQEKPQKVGLVLTGGGAKAAYQVGVIKAILEVLPERCENPFPVIAGASAGAINSTFMAAYAHRPRIGIRRLEQAWTSLHVSHIYHVSWSYLIRNTFRWLGQFLRASSVKRKPLSLFFNDPLRRFLTKVIPLPKIEQNINNGNLYAVSITAYGYYSGDSVTFYEADSQVTNWNRYHRIGIKEHLNIKHLMASAAIPLFFPAEKINREYFGDGSVGLLSPISPSLHMGADKIIVISTDSANKRPINRPLRVQYPTLADIGGKLMDSIFTDSLESDVERLERINHTLELIPDKYLSQNGNQLKHVDILRFSPEFDIDALANKHFEKLPKLLKFFLKRAGINGEDGANILSYLLFEKAFTKELIKKGYEDGITAKNSILNFFSEPETGEIANN